MLTSIEIKKEYYSEDLTALIKRERFVTYYVKENKDNSITIRCEFDFWFKGKQYSGHKKIRLENE